ncbi:TetR/AcrR family transcriptional regulator [Vibrio sp. SCSIO 43136]|uniref:TetR/AcrR family transcriptional regulator n=1 Tax=Vibrio sp. SCSIO 43136 TaxID=2819101 RepID=UPI00207657AD|nr:TetR/AcrR family transcriptional regulator [Vibrio sp. SCSIO 43136]USD67423.1 TetR/AcrR family transcriptional regulator [Vibrio sp. SCSIO 43136]
MKLSKTKLKIVEAANKLFYEQGYEHTSFTQIADVVGISRGNFYYHYKTKDEILAAVIEMRMSVVKSYLDSWEANNPTPQMRIKAFINSAVFTQSDTEKYGCPIGTLSTELNKLSHPAQEQVAGFFTLFRCWLGRQFDALGFAKEADELALNILAQNQGAAVLASTLNDQSLVERQAKRMEAWLDELIHQSNPK